MLLFGAINGYNFNYKPQLYVSADAGILEDGKLRLFNDKTIAILENGKLSSRKQPVGLLPSQILIKPLASYAIFAKSWNKGSVYEAWYPIENQEHICFHYIYENSTMTSSFTLARKAEKGYYDLTVPQPIPIPEGEFAFPDSVINIEMSPEENAEGSHTLSIQTRGTDNWINLSISHVDMSHRFEAAQAVMQEFSDLHDALLDYGELTPIECLGVLQEQPYTYEEKKVVIGRYWEILAALSSEEVWEDGQVLS